MNDTSKPIARIAGFLLVLGACLPNNPSRGDDPPKGGMTWPILTLADGGVVPGTLVNSGEAGVVRWQGASFADAFEFPGVEVLSIRFPASERSPKARGALGFELSGGDVLYGSLVELDGKSAGLDVPGIGRLRVDRSRIRRVFRWRDGSDMLLDGPNGLVGWKEIAPARAPIPARAAMPPIGGFVLNGDVNALPQVRPKPAPPGPGWVEDGRTLRATRDGVTIQGDVGLPPRASIELQLGWDREADFLLALGVSDDEASVARAFRLEVWAGKLVAVRETDKEADVVSIQPIAEGPGRVRLQLFLDQLLGKLAVYSEAGQPLAELAIGAGLGLPGVRLTNIRGDLRLERLRVGRWDGETPRPVGLDEAIVRLVDRSVLRGRIEHFEPATREFVVVGESGGSRVAGDQVESIAFPRQGDEPRRPVLVSYHDGNLLGGEWTGVEGGKVVLTAPGFDGPVRLVQQGMRSVDVAKEGAKPRERGRDDRVGELEMDGTRTLGRLVDSGVQPGKGPLAWQPLAGGPAAVIRPDASGRIVYRRTPQAKPADPPIVRTTIVRLNAAGAPVSQAAPPPDRIMPPMRRSLYLRSGDIIPVEVTTITDEGVSFRTKFSDNGFVPNDRVKAVELAQEDASSTIRVNKAKLERLLTLPRMQKESPPRHLIRSTNGDILRGTVTGMDEKSITVEVRLQEKVIPRDRVARIIWLHPDETDQSKKRTEPAKPAPGMRVQAVRSDGVRLTFTPVGFAEGTLSGRSEMLGDCKVRVQDLEHLLIGGAVEKEAVQLAYQNFKLQLAAEPKAALAERGELPEGGPDGTESSLVGKPAPDFQLDLMDGTKFRLSENKGKVIVLDFWATWCGPCLQAMPQIDRATHEFADKGVRLIAVNLQESPAKIKALLERIKLSPEVVLDCDGVVAARYGASAIPQTVVIDREGKVTRLFIGGGPHLGDQLREALQAATAPAAK